MKDQRNPARVAALLTADERSIMLAEGRYTDYYGSPGNAWHQLARRGLTLPGTCRTVIKHTQFGKLVALAAARRLLARDESSAIDRSRAMRIVEASQ